MTLLLPKYVSGPFYTGGDERESLQSSCTSEPTHPNVYVSLRRYVRYIYIHGHRFKAFQLQQGDQVERSLNSNKLFGFVRD